MPKEKRDSSYFRPKRPIDISRFDLSWETGRSPVMTPMSKLSPLYHDTIQDYMHGKMQRRPSGFSVYSFDSIIFDNKGFPYTRSLTDSTLVSEASTASSEASGSSCSEDKSQRTNSASSGKSVTHRWLANYYNSWSSMCRVNCVDKCYNDYDITVYSLYKVIRKRYLCIVNKATNIMQWHYIYLFYI